MLFAWINEIQRQNGILGDIFEIGCHHGKSTLFLGAMINPLKEKLCVCDLFDNQDTNISCSGNGDLDIFRKNLSFLSHKGIETLIFRNNSMDLSSKDIGDMFRFFHIDGGHTAIETLTDLRLAASSIIENGIIALDDPFRPEWPGVTEGLINFLDENTQFCSIIVGFNKLFLTRQSSSDMYLNAIQNMEHRKAYGLDFPWQTKKLDFKGQPLEIFYLPSTLSERRLWLSLRKYYRKHNWIKSRPFQPLIALANFILRRSL